MTTSTYDSARFAAIRTELDQLRIGFVAAWRRSPSSYYLQQLSDELAALEAERDAMFDDSPPPVIDS